MIGKFKKMKCAVAASRCAGKRASLPQPTRRRCAHACYTRRAPARDTPMRLTLVLPGLLDRPLSALAGVEKQAPALARLVADGGSPTIEQDGLVATACRVCGIAKQQDWPVAPWLARAAGVDPGGAYWLCAEPARFIVGQSDVRLGGLISDLDAADAGALVAMLNTHFAADRIQFVAPTPSRWFACADHSPRIITRPPEAALGAPLLAYLTSGPDAARWGRWQNELQMLLFEHAVNRGREARGQTPVDSVWFWGGGTLARQEAPANATIFADGGLVFDLARSIGLEPEPLPASFNALPDAVAHVVWLGAIEADAAAEQLSAIDRAWFAPAKRALHAGAMREVDLVIAGRTLALGFRVLRPSIARRWRSGFSSPRVSPLLARFATEAMEG
jgi:hypothetical protein